MSFDEGMSSNRYALGEVFDFAQKVKATVVEPYFSNGRMGSCKDIDNITVRGALLGEVYELKKLRRIAPVMPYAEFVNISQRFKLGETKVVCLHAGTGGSHCVGIENRCKKDLGTFGFVPGVKVLEIRISNARRRTAGKQRDAAGGTIINGCKKHQKLRK